MVQHFACLLPGPFKASLFVQRHRFAGSRRSANRRLRLLASGDVRLPLLTLFLLGETFVWSSYGPYMSEAFRVGLYIFHIAAAGFYHYLTAYFFAESANYSRRDASLMPGAILAINVAIVSAGCAVAWFPVLHLLRPVFGVEWFTLWVALHLGQAIRSHGGSGIFFAKNSPADTLNPLENPSRSSPKHVSFAPFMRGALQRCASFSMSCKRADAPQSPWI